MNEEEPVTDQPINEPPPETSQATPEIYRDRLDGIQRLLSFQTTDNSVEDIKRFVNIPNYTGGPRIQLEITPANIIQALKELRAIRSANQTVAEARGIHEIDISSPQAQIKSDRLIENAVIDRLIAEFDPSVGDTTTDAINFLKMMQLDTEERFQAASNDTETDGPSPRENIAKLYENISRVIKELEEKNKKL